MTFELWLVYLTTVVFLCLTPGPNSLLALANGARYGLRSTLFSTVGCLTGIALLIAIAISGLGIILSTSYIAFLFIKWLGVAYLIYLGVSLIFSKQKPVDQPGLQSKSTLPSQLRLFTQGLLIVLTNPKVLIFFMAFLSQFINHNAPMFNQYLILTCTFISVEFILEVLLAIFADNLNKQLSQCGFLNIVNKITGGIFISAAVYLMGTQRN